VPLRFMPYKHRHSTVVAPRLRCDGGIISVKLYFQPCSHQPTLRVSVSRDVSVYSPSLRQVLTPPTLEAIYSCWVDSTCIY